MHDSQRPILSDLQTDLQPMLLPEPIGHVS